MARRTIGAWGRRSLLVVTAVATSALGVAAVSAVARPHVAPRAVAPHATVIAHTYFVTTTADDTLWSGAPAHTCEDTTHHQLCSLRAAVAAAAGDFSTADVWDNVSLPAGTYALSPTVSTSPLLINAAGQLTITGTGWTKTTINGSALSFDEELVAVTASGVDLVVSGVEFAGGSAAAGGAISVVSGDTLAVSSCAFASDAATGEGGAISATGNVAVTVTNSTFASDRAGGDGGAVYDSSPTGLTLSGDVFSHDQTTGTGAGAVGGAVDGAGPVTVDHTVFSHDTAGGSGGALYAARDLVGSADTLTANAAADGVGGALDVGANIELTNSTFKENTSSANGGGLAVWGLGSLSGDAFVMDAAGGSGGDAWVGGSLTISGSSFLQSTASASGGAIYESGGTLQLSSDTFTDTVARGAATNAGGGAVYLNGGAGTLADTTVAGAKAPAASGSGGAVACVGCALTVTDGRYAKNKAGGAGGAFWLTNAAEGTFAGTMIDDNTGYTGGGVTVTGSSDVTMTTSTVDGNDSTFNYGGGLSIIGSSLTLDASTVAFNRAVGAAGWGGGLALFNVNATPATGDLLNDTIAQNTALYAGGVYAYGSTLTVASSTVAENALAATMPARHGGGLYNNDSTVTTTDTIWAQNGGAQCGGQSEPGGTAVTDSGGFNLATDGSCSLHGAGDQARTVANLGALGPHGGLTATIEPVTPSAAMGGGGLACPTRDQRGTHVPVGDPCDVGSVYVEATKTTLALSKTTLVVGSEATERFTVTVAATVAGAVASGVFKVTFGSTTLCTGTLAPAATSASGGSVGSCTLSASQLAANTYTVRATYGGFNDLASSLSKKLTLTVAT